MAQAILAQGSSLPSQPSLKPKRFRTFQPPRSSSPGCPAMVSFRMLIIACGLVLPAVSLESVGGGDLAAPEFEAAFAADDACLAGGEDPDCALNALQVKKDKVTANAAASEGNLEAKSGDHSEGAQKEDANKQAWGSRRRSSYGYGGSHNGGGGSSYGHGHSSYGGSAYGGNHYR
mmetsp:Transcript_54032/g.153094  ORF Transcript_54032/g.153094 Transcript_54032/m.153094 type:complete len:175 (-) Transcript_54032:96-620(-)